MRGETAVVTRACLGCGACLLTCPERAIRPAPPAGRLLVLPRCTGCGECAEVCPADAIGFTPVGAIGFAPEQAAGLPTGRATTTEAT